MSCSVPRKRTDSKVSKEELKLTSNFSLHDGAGGRNSHSWYPMKDKNKMYYLRQYLTWRPESMVKTTVKGGWPNDIHIWYYTEPPNL